MSKIKTWLIGFAIIFAISAVVGFNIQRKAIIRLRAEKIRLTENIGQLLDENTDYQILTLTQKEAIRASSLKIDSITHLLKIKPKQVERIIYKEIIQHDTTIVQIPAAQINDTTWKFTDAGNCFVYKGEVSLSDNIVGVKRVDFVYRNNIVDTYFWKRSFWIFSKKRYFQESITECDAKVTTKEVIIKKK
jgi:hypothetical protein